MKIKIKAVSFAAATVFFCTSVLALMPTFSTVAEYESAGYKRMDSLDILLLAQKKTGVNIDVDSLFNAAGDGFGGALRQRYENLKQIKDKTERFESGQAIAYELQDRQSSLNQAKGFLLPLNASVSSYDSARGGLPLTLSLNIYPDSMKNSYQCAGLQSLGNIGACISGLNLESDDPVFKLIPVPSADIGNLIKSEIEAKRISFYALAEPSASYQVGSNIPKDYIQKGIVGNQPTRIVGVVLVKTEDQHVLANTNAQAVQVASAAEADQGKQNQPGKNGVRENAKGISENINIASVAKSNRPADNNNQNGNSGSDLGKHNEKFGVNTDPLTPEEPQGPELTENEQVLDRLLSWLSYTIYSSQKKVADAKRDLMGAETKYLTISREENRKEQKKELESTQLSIEVKQQKLDRLQAMLDFKNETESKFNIRRIESSAIEGINYERYRTADKKEIIVFRGTDSKVDWETDFQLGFTPETVSELTKGWATGSDLMAKSLASKMYDMKGPSVEGVPAPFVAADMLVYKLIKSGVPANRIILTGHSLGGGLAQYAGLRRGVDTIVTFNTAPLNNRLRQGIDFSAFPGKIRNYASKISYANGSNKVVFDPVSKYGISGNETLEVFGPMYFVEVCNNLSGPDFKFVRNITQGLVTSGTIKAIAGDKYKTTRKVNTATYVAGNVVAADSYRGSAGWSGFQHGELLGNGAVAAINCTKNFLRCGAKAAAGGLASVGVDVALGHLWTLYDAHRMKGLFDSLHGYSEEGCANL